MTDKVGTSDESSMWKIRLNRSQYKEEIQGWKIK